MDKFTRRNLLKTGMGAAAGIGLTQAGLPLIGAAEAQEVSFKPEPKASLRVLRWSKFVQGDEDQFIANTKKFTEKYGVPVRIDNESWEDIRPKAAVAANVGSGPDVMLVWFDDPLQYPEKLLDVTDIATSLGKKYGGWYEGPEGYCKYKGRWVGLPVGTIGNAIIYRKSVVEAAGFSEFPKDTAGFLKLLQAMKAAGKPAGFTLGNAVGDGNNYAHWVMWSHGGQMVDEKGNVVINSPQTVAALEYARELYKTFIPGTESWLDANNNRAYLAGEVSMTANGVSLYYSAKNDPKTKELADDSFHASFPIGPVGKSTELFQTTEAVIFKYTKFPNAAKEYLRFMWEKEQFSAWITASSGYICQPLKGYRENPVWTSDPKHAAYADCSARLRPNGYAGPLGYASAASMADYIVVNMVAEASTGQQSPKDAAARAEKRALRYYKV